MNIREIAWEVIAPATLGELIFGALFVGFVALLVVGFGGGPL